VINGFFRRVGFLLSAPPREKGRRIFIQLKHSRQDDARGILFPVDSQKRKHGI
jgi:hypothetical protein